MKVKRKNYRKIAKKKKEKNILFTFFFFYAIRKVIDQSVAGLDIDAQTSTFSSGKHCARNVCDVGPFPFHVESLDFRSAVVSRILFFFFLSKNQKESVFHSHRWF